MIPKPRNSHLVGVVDLLGGRAVHAIKGQRDRYQPVPFCNGDPKQLVDHYLSLGINKFYVADLDAITGRAQSICSVENLVRSSFAFDKPSKAADEGIKRGIDWMVDAGPVINFDVKSEIAKSKNISWVAATESMQSLDDLSGYREFAGSNRVLLSLDFRDGELLGTESNPAIWIDQAMKLGIKRVIVLDLAGVGSSAGPRTGAICADIRQKFPDVVLHSGGGIRNQHDVEMLASDGCDFFLVATCMFPEAASSHRVPPGK